MVLTFSHPPGGAGPFGKVATSLERQSDIQVNCASKLEYFLPEDAGFVSLFVCIVAFILKGGKCFLFSEQNFSAILLTLIQNNGVQIARHNVEMATFLVCCTGRVVWFGCPAG